MLWLFYTHWLRCKKLFYIYCILMYILASDVIKESERSDVMLKCDYAYYARKTEDVDIMWFQGDRLVHENKTKRIHDKVILHAFLILLHLHLIWLLCYDQRQCVIHYCTVYLRYEYICKIF